MFFPPVAPDYLAPVELEHRASATSAFDLSADSRDWYQYDKNVGYNILMNSGRDKRAKFVELGEARVTKAAQMLRLIGNLSNRSNYEYSQEDALKILSALDAELKLLRAKFQAEISRRTRDEFKLGEGKK